MLKNIRLEKTRNHAGHSRKVLIGGMLSAAKKLKINLFTMTFVETLLIASIPSVITGIISYLVFHQQITSYKRETMAERAAKHFLLHKGYQHRSFQTLKKHLGGWDNDEDELRRILVRAGAVRTYRGKEEWWILLSRMREKIEKLERQENE